MFTRKSMFVALTVLVMLAMLVPAAMAAPEMVTGVTIQSPTGGSIAYLDPPATLAIHYTINVTGQQVTPVTVTFTLIPENGASIEHTTIIPAGALVAGPNPLVYNFDVPATAPEGFYGLRICINDSLDPFCTTAPRSVFLRNNLPPTVTLERPAWNVDVCTWVTGDSYELFGMATDDWAIDHAWFEYTTNIVANPPIKIGNELAAVGQNASPVPGFPGEYRATWNSSLVPDGPGFIRFCATDSDNVTVCTAWNDVCIENRVKVSLQKGWNLISTPLILYNKNVADVLSHVWNPLTSTPWQTAPIDAIVTTRDGGVTWPSWMASAPGAFTIDDGYGYWVHVLAPAQIEFIGTWLSIGPNAPPEYPVHEGWNLIGYTHFGTPTMGPWPADNQTVTDYLGFPMIMSLESMYRYDAAQGLYIEVDEGVGEKTMMQGAGYWLALAEGTEGTINP